MNESDSRIVCAKIPIVEREKKEKEDVDMSKLEFHFIVKQKNCHSSHSFSFLFISFFTHFFIVRSRPIFFSLLSKQLSIFMMSIGHVKTQDFSHLTLHIGDESKNVINLKRKKFFFKMISSNSLNIFAARWTWKCDDTVKMPYNS